MRYFMISAAAVGFLTIGSASEAKIVEISQGQRVYIAKAIGPNQQICLDFNDAATGAPAEVHLWRRIQPINETRDLGRALGRRCLRTRGIEYEVDVMAIRGIVRVRIPDQYARP